MYPCFTTSHQSFCQDAWINKCCLNSKRMSIAPRFLLYVRSSTRSCSVRDWRICLVYTGPYVSRDRFPKRNECRESIDLSAVTDWVCACSTERMIDFHLILYDMCHMECVVHVLWEEKQSLSSRFSIHLFPFACRVGFLWYLSWADTLSVLTPDKVTATNWSMLLYVFLSRRVHFKRCARA